MVFPNDYWGSFKKFQEVLPCKDEFYNTLTNCSSNDKNGELGLNVWKTFKMNTMKDYHEFYLQILCLKLLERNPQILLN